jgi:hypothetical protein
VNTVARMPSRPRIGAALSTVSVRPSSNVSSSALSGSSSIPARHAVICSGVTVW